MKPRQKRTPKPKPLLIDRPTLDEQLCISLGYENVRWPDPRVADRDFPRGVWKCPKTGNLHTPKVVRIMQKPDDPNGKPFAEPMSLSEVRRLESEERRALAAQEVASIRADNLARMERLRAEALLNR